MPRSPCTPEQLSVFRLPGAIVFFIPLKLVFCMRLGGWNGSVLKLCGGQSHEISDLTHRFAETLNGRRTALLHRHFHVLQKQYRSIRRWVQSAFGTPFMRARRLISLEGFVR